MRTGPVRQVESTKPLHRIADIVEHAWPVFHRLPGESRQRHPTELHVDPRRIERLAIVRSLAQAEHALGGVVDELLSSEAGNDLCAAQEQAVIGKEQLHIEVVAVSNREWQRLARRRGIRQLDEEPGFADMKVGAEIETMEAVAVAVRGERAVIGCYEILAQLPRERQMRRAASRRRDVFERVEAIGAVGRICQRAPVLEPARQLQRRALVRRSCRRREQGIRIVASLVVDVERPAFVLRRNH